MLSLLARLVYSCSAYAYPVFASYKALKANDPTQTTPWLMYWIVLACLLFAESFTLWLLRWLPLYYEARAVLLLWLVLPQTQGAAKIYVAYVHPALLRHEPDIDRLVSAAAGHARSAGIHYVHKLAAAVKALLFGPRTATATVPRTATPATFAQSLFARLRLEAPPSSFLSFISQPPPRAALDILPRGLADPAERKKYILAQKERLLAWMKVLDDADVSGHTTPAYPSGDEFESVDRDEAAAATPPRRATSWWWAAAAAAAAPEQAER